MIIPRIIAGSARGTVLKAPKGDRTRPTIDRTKEALFSILLPRIRDSVVLDLFAGTGALGLEALSRGALKAYLNDFNADCVSIIKENAIKSRLNELCKITQFDFKRAIESINEKIDIVFLDPPYEKGFITSSIEKLHDNDIININGLIVCEHGKNEILEDNMFGFTLIDRRKYGIATISIYKKGEII
ncbi:MAG: 16S rRNA (guanine(966)-N(2))-methyltransferase RsmD [Clostridia bacterium]|nr:16S rRNA (guanine(966)-N(2))-methyltransferase RsmD [Clostridia bacterium]